MRKFFVLTLAMIIAVFSSVTGFAVMGKSDIIVGDYVYYASGLSGNYKFRVVDIDATTGDLILLFADTDNIIAKRSFGVSNEAWANSPIRTYLNSRSVTAGEEAKFLDLFTKTERSALERVIANEDQVMLPSLADIKDNGAWDFTNGDRARKSDWWLRDIDAGPNMVKIVKQDGTLGSTSPRTAQLGVMPVIRVKISEILYALPVSESVISVNKELTKVTPRTGAEGELKLVLKDHSNQKLVEVFQSHFANPSANDDMVVHYGSAFVNNTANITVPYTTKVISCIIWDKVTDEPLYYGMLSTFTNNIYPANGTLQFKLPADYDSTKHDMSFYAQSIHRDEGKKLTDYISAGVSLGYVPAPPIPPTKYTLTIHGGGAGSFGSGNYSENDVVPIYAGAIDGHTFSHWSQIIEGGISATISDPILDRTTATMPAGNTVLVANWTPPLTQYTLTVENGGVGSFGSGNYSENDVVPIYAGLKENYTFDGWTVTTSMAGITVDVGDLTADSTDVKMPADNVVIRANWKTESVNPPIDPPINPPVNPPDNDNDGDYEEPIITTTTEPEKIPPMPQEPLAVEPPNTETGDNSLIGLAVTVLFGCGIVCGTIAGMAYKKHKQGKDKDIV